MSLRHTQGKRQSFVSLPVYVKQLSGRFALSQQSRKGQLCLSRRKGIPDASSSPRRDGRCHVVWLSQNLWAVAKLLFRSRNSGLSGWLSEQPLFCYFPTEFYTAKKGYYAKIPLRSARTDKKALLQHAEMLAWPLKPQGRVLLFCKMRELKLQSSNH